MKIRRLSLLVTALWVMLLASASAAQAPKPTSAPSAKPEGTLVAAVSTLGSESWLGVYENPMTNQYSAPCYDFLLKRNKDGSVGPNLVEKWEMARDATSYTLRLRKGVQFHDGWGELTAEDVKLSFEIARSEGSRNDQSNLFRTNIGEIEVVNPYQIKLHMKVPDWTLVVKSLTDQLPYLPIVSKKYVEKVGREAAAKHPIGTGPYKFVEHKRGDYIKLQALENHWRKRAETQTLIFKKVPEPATRVAMLKSGEAQLIEIKHESIKELKASPGIRIQSIPGGVFAFMSLYGQYLPERKGYNPKVPWAQPDAEKALKVRRALSLAINRQEIIDHVLGGYGSVKDSAVIFWWPGHEGWNPAWKVDPYAPARAKQLLAEAGYANPKDLSVTVNTVRHPGRPWGGDIAEAVGLQWSNLGITVKMQYLEYATFWAAAVNRENAGQIWCYPAPWSYHPIMVLRSVAHSKLRSFMVGEYPALDRLLDAVNEEFDPKKRVQKTRELGDYLYKNIISIPLFFADIILGVSDKLEWDTVGPASGGYIADVEYMKLAR